MIYLDNAATSYPKPACVAEAVVDYIKNIGANVGRGSYSNAYRAEEMVFETRELLAKLFHAPISKNVVFTKNVTESLNVILKGFLRSGDHVLVSSMEHNAVMRPLVQMEGSGVSFSRIPCDTEGNLELQQVERLIRPETVAIVMTHASNVCGTVLPIREVGSLCEKHGLKFIVDAAQTAGFLPVDMIADHIDALAFTGHKGLLGPQGIGGFILQDRMVPLMIPLISGGTGSISHTEEIPGFMPDRFEAGTMNLPGIAGLNAALGWLSEKEKKVSDHEKFLTGCFLEGLETMERSGLIRIVGRRDNRMRTGVVSVTTERRDIAQIAFELDYDYGVMTRVGMHCAPFAHKTLNTFPGGTLRFSFGWNNTEEEADLTLKALKKTIEG